MAVSEKAPGAGSSWLRRNTIGRLPIIVFLSLLPLEFAKMALGRQPRYGQPLPLYSFARRLRDARKEKVKAAS
ncbi:MAG: hypothetical protein ACK4S3_07220 [Parvibaculum sp.]